MNGHLHRSLRNRIIAALGEKYADSPRYNPDTRRYDRPPTFEEQADSPMFVTETDEGDGLPSIRGATVAEVTDVVLGALGAAAEPLSAAPVSEPQSTGDPGAGTCCCEEGDVAEDASRCSERLTVHSERDAAANLVTLREAVQRVLDDEESGEGGWGPDVTMVAVLREAMEATKP